MVDNEVTKPLFLVKDSKSIGATAASDASQSTLAASPSREARVHVLGGGSLTETTAQRCPNYFLWEFSY